MGIYGLGCGSLWRCELYLSDVGREGDSREIDGFVFLGRIMFIGGFMHAIKYLYQIK